MPPWSNPASSGSSPTCAGPFLPFAGSVLSPPSIGPPASMSAGCAPRSAAKHHELSLQYGGADTAPHPPPVVRGDRPPHRAFSFTAQPHQHPCAVLHHGGHRHGHDRRDRGRGL